MELGKAIELFLGDYKASTYNAYKPDLHKLRDWIGPARQVSDITPPMLVEYFQKSLGKKGYAVATVQKAAKTIKTFFNWCVRLDLIARSPAYAVRARKPSRRISREKAMNEDELEELLNFLRYKTNPRDFALVLFLADTGCRRGGAAGLRLKDIQWDKLLASVTEKGEQSRTVAFSEQCSKAMLRWITYRSEHFTVRGVYVFSQEGQPMNAEQISQNIRRACKKAGIRSLSAHSLRHRKGHQFADHRIAPSLAATYLGHANVLTTLEHYYPTDWESAERAGRELMTAAPEKKIVQFGH